MFSKQMISTKQVIRAALLGIVIGLAGVGIFALFLMNASAPVDAPAVTTDEGEEGDVVEVNTLPQKNVRLYASQHGAFTALDSATEFMSAYPTLNKALVVQVGDKFYVWSAVSPGKLESKMEPTSFSKSFQFYSEACPQDAIANIPIYVQDENKLKNNFEQSTNGGQAPDDWKAFMESITALSDDINVIRLHALAHFYEQQDCLKIKFDE
ncbi:hypothetical protein [Lysinibacillus sp. LZ02]|uniref:hypothetical protein n=1 Tax=Lysinibacillus sp. LZ02 TaxID=3420668 RepID=UPI003D364DE0